MKYILQTCLCNSKLQNVVFVHGVLASIFSGMLLITTLSTDIFKDGRGYNVSNFYYTYYETTTLYWSVVFVCLVHLISSIFLAIGAEKKNVYMFVPWMIVQALTLAPVFPIIIGAFLCSAVVSIPLLMWWTVFSLFVTLREEQSQCTAVSPSTVAATAPPSAVLYANHFDDIPLPAYNDVVPGSVTKNH